jgi:8-oxo-dGTP pyrophosphatase MutT (NUDIX family)
MHWIQRHIIDYLIHTDIARFSDLRADGVESNLFQYHLRHLIQQGWVQKVEGGYTLAPAGLYYADRFSSELKGERQQPKIITMAVVKNTTGQVFLQQKVRQPWIGAFHIPAGKLHMNEETGDAAVREFYEKTGVRLEDGVEFRAVAHVIIRRGEELISDYIGFIFSGLYEGDIDTGLWYEEERDGDEVTLAPSVQEILALERLGDEGFHTFDISVE